MKLCCGSALDESKIFHVHPKLGLILTICKGSDWPEMVVEIRSAVFVILSVQLPYLASHFL